MLRLGALLFVVSLAWLANSQPIDAEDGWVRVQRSAMPGRMMLVGNYGNRQPTRYQGAHATGPAYYGSRRSQLVDERPDVEKPEERSEEEEPMEDEAVEDEEVMKSEAPKVAPKAPKAPKRRVTAEDEDDEEEVSAPRRGTRKQADIPTYSNFFPIVFARSTAGSRRRSSGDDAGEEEGAGHGLIAISNSFSTGRGAISSSTSNAYGGRSPMQVPANAPTQYRKSAPSRYRS